MTRIRVLTRVEDIYFYILVCYMKPYVYRGKDDEYIIGFDMDVVILKPVEDNQ